MQSWILAFALVLAAGHAVADEAPIASAESPVPVLEPDVVPPIPPPGERMTPVVPLDRTWPSVAQAVVDPSATVVPPIPAPFRMETEAPPAAPAGALGEAPAPGARRTFDPKGTVHVVEKGDTLWDISDLYLGTPWIWPSIWKDNEEIENPHLILPGDKIWVSATEMRKISDEEAAALLAGADDEDEPAPAAMAEDVPAVPAPEPPREVFQYTEMAQVGVVTEKELRGLAKVVGTTQEQIFLSQGDTVFVDLGEQDVAEGDRFELFRTSQKIYDPASRRSIGYHAEVVGWLEITEVHAETARAKVRQAYAEFVPGVYLRPRETPITQIVIQDSPPGVEGQIADLLLDPKYRAGGDVVVLNRGREHGLEAGSVLEVYRPVSSHWKDTWYGREPDVEIPHEVVADLIVLKAQPKTAMAYVRRSADNTELQHGDRFRTVGGPSVDWPEGGIFVLPAQLRSWASRVPSPGMPDVDVPGAIDRWNLPKLSLPALEGYDPR